MKANWESDAATKAGADLGKMRIALGEAATHLKTASAAVDTYWGALIKIRSDVDDLRRQLTTHQGVLSAEEEAFARSGRFGEVNQMTPAELGSYRKGLAGDEAATQRQIRHLHDEYTALVRRANTATATCREALTVSAHGAQYNGSTISTVGLGPALGLGNLTLLTAWEAAVEKNPPAFPKGKTPAETAQFVAAYWASLPPEVRAAFLHSDPRDVGKTDGVPVADRSSANVILAHRDQSPVVTALKQLHLSPAEIAAIKANPELLKQYGSGLTINGQMLTRVQIQSFINASDCLNALSSDH